MSNTQPLDKIYTDIFQRGKTHELGIYKMAAHLGYTEKKYSLLFFKELTQQILYNRSTMIEIFGKKITNQIADLNLKVDELHKSNANGR